MRVERNSILQVGGLAFDMTCGYVKGTGGSKRTTRMSDRVNNLVHSLSGKSISVVT